ncbi:MAG TPA: PGF-CTERM sorting domain-containing protein [Candidatus Bathyarchaeia archaeon]|nr:PGF-CTERM sorting domain-containing protein [Candidatus Bathyarchaeia archaeon]
MPRLIHYVTLLLISSIAVLVLVGAVITPSAATTMIQLQPTTVHAGDRVLISANMQRNGSTVTLSYYYDKNGNGLADDQGSSWVKIADVTDGGANDSKNVSNGYILFSWITPELTPGQYIIRVEDPYGPTRTTELTVDNAPLSIVPTIYGSQGNASKQVVNTGNSFSVIAMVQGNCRICHQTDFPTTQNPGVNDTAVESLFSANLSQITGSVTDSSVPPNLIGMSLPSGLVEWYGMSASKTLADGQTLSITVTGTNPAGNLTTQATAYAGVNKAVNIPPTSTNQNANGTAQSSATAQSSSSGGNPLPGFEIIFALAGLTFVAYVLSRKR